MQGPMGSPMYAPGGMGGPAGGMGPGSPSPQSALFNYYNQGAAGGPMGMGPPDGPMGMGGPPPGMGAPGGPPGRLPPDPFGPQRLHMPIPSRNDDFAGGTEKNIDTRPDARGIGPRLDSSYTFFREWEVGYYGSEHQHVTAAAISWLPIQTPCWVVGARTGLSWNFNTGVADDMIGATTDLFWGTRFGHTYFKIGYFCDWTSDFRKHGIESSILTKLGPLGNVTFDGAFGFGAGDDIFESRHPLTNLARRTEIARDDFQIRVGKFLSPYFQTGLSGAWTNFATSENEFSGGLFANWFVGRTTLSVDLTGGTSGLRGYLVCGFNWGGGANIDAHPIDPYFDNPIDTTSWVTRATRRDITMKLRESETGFGPPQILPVILE
jgi:hypothetical protein